MTRILGVMGVITCLTIAGLMYQVRDHIPARSAPGVQRLAKGVLSGGATVAVCGALIIGIGTTLIRRG